MKKLLLRLASASLLAFALSGAAMATPLNGNILFSGKLSLNNSFDLATGVASWTNVKVEASDGDFIGLVNNGDTVTIAAPWLFNSGSIPAFWTVDGFTFDLTSSTIEYHTATSISVTGTGWAYGNGFDPAPGTWNFSTQNISVGGSFSFSASSSVPDGGTTALLLGVGLVAVSFIARRKTA